MCVDLRRVGTSEGVVAVGQHGVGPVWVAVGSSGTRWSAGRDGGVAREGRRAAQTGGAVLALAAEQRLQALAAATATGRVWLATQK